MALTSTIDSLKKNYEPYSVTAGVGEDGLYTTKITGDREGGLFKQQEGMGKMDFLKLLTTQLQYQDPLSPMENTEFVAQLAQFSQLESATSMESAMQEMSKTFNDSMDLQTINSLSTTNAASVALVGKEVRLRENTFNHNSSAEPRTFKAHLGEHPSAIVSIVDGDGVVIKSIKLEGKDDTNAVEFTWDGKNDKGEKMPTDKYNLIIQGQENDTSLYCFVEDFVTGIRYDANGKTFVRVSGKELPVGDLLEVKHPSATSGDAYSDLSMGQALSLIGYDVKLGGIEKVTYTPKPNDQILFDLDLGGMQTAKLLIKDKNGVVQETIEVNKSGRIEIDKRSYNSSDVYTIEIDKQHNANAYFYKSGTIDGVTKSSGGIPMLNVGGELINASRIMELSAPKPKQEAA
jgi:flagellar basal-body rod modification protein FlgD